MPNGADKNWVRLRAAINGFRLRHGHWPTQIRLHPVSLANLRDHVFEQGVFRQIEQRLTFVPDDKAGMVAQDASGAEYNYGTEGFPPTRPDVDAREWLGNPRLNPQMEE